MTEISDSMGNDAAEGVVGQARQRETGTVNSAAAKQLKALEPDCDPKTEPDCDKGDKK